MADTSKVFSPSHNRFDGGIHRQGHHPRSAVWTLIRRLDRVSGLARRLTVSASIPIAVLAISVLKTRRLDDPREQHRPDDRLGWRISGRRRRLHRPRVDLPAADGPKYFNYADHDAGVCRRHSRRVDDGSAQARPHRQGTRRAAYPEGTACAQVSSLESAAASWRGSSSAASASALWKSLSWTFNLFRGTSAIRCRAPASFRTPPSASTSRPSISAWDT